MAGYSQEGLKSLEITFDLSSYYPAPKKYSLQLKQPNEII
jgi:hypothetical protein